jgi:biopolymer transport protein ExbB/TolQ
MSVLSLIVKGGVLMYVLMVISVISFGIVIEKYRQLRKVKAANRKLDLQLKQRSVKTAPA